MALFDVQALNATALPATSFSLEAGELVCLSGPSGCGKTRLLRALADLDISTGDIRLNGVVREQYPPTQWRSQVAYLPAESRWWAATVGEHFPNVDTQAFAQLGFEADEVAGWQVERLSSGERQRLALLRVLVNRPAVLLLDEPTANLDEANTRQAEALVTDYLRAHTAGCLWVSHDAQQAGRIATRRLAMDAGGVEAAA